MASYPKHTKAARLVIDGHINATGTNAVEIGIWKRNEREFNMFGILNILAMQSLATNRTIRHTLDHKVIQWFMLHQDKYEPVLIHQRELAVELSTTQAKISESLKRLVDLKLIEQIKVDRQTLIPYRMNPSLYFKGHSSECTKAISDWCERHDVMPLPGCFSENKIKTMLANRGTAAANVHAFTPQPSAA